MPAYTPVRMPSRAVSAIEAAAPSGVVGEMTDASCDTDTLEIDSDEDEW